MNPVAKLPRWAELGLLPLINLCAALLISGLIIRLIGESPWAALKLLVAGAFGTQDSIGYTLFYATDFVFTGLAVAVAFHAGLFNIGGEGQAYVGGLGVGLVCLAFGAWSPWVVIPLAILSGCAFGAAWAFVPGWLQARRGSHIVITTIMANFIASALMTYLLVNVLIKPGPAVSRDAGVWFGRSHARRPRHELLAKFGIPFAPSPFQPGIAPRARRLSVRVGLHLAHPLGIRDAGRRPEPAGCPVCRDIARAHHPGRHGHFRRLGRMPGGQ